jgi:hypothetical protein
VNVRDANDASTRASRIARGIAAAWPAIFFALVLIGAAIAIGYSWVRRVECESVGGRYVRDGFTGWPTCIDARAR